MAEKQIVYKMVPCSVYDIERLESWLSDMAEEGLFLSNSGFIMQFAAFTRGTPVPVRHRIIASPGKGPSGYSDSERPGLEKDRSWEYIASQGDLQIYRTTDPSAQEMDIDPDAEAIAVSAIKKLRLIEIAGSLLIIFIIPFILLHGGMILTAIVIGAVPLVLLGIAAVLNLAAGIRRYVLLSRIRKRLEFGSTGNKEKDWRKGAAAYKGSVILRAVTSLILVACLLYAVSSADRNYTTVSLNKYVGQLPFATMRDLVGDGIREYRPEMQGSGSSFNYVKTGSSWLTPVFITYNEYATITRTDGSAISGGIYIDYYETSSKSVADRLVREIYNITKGGRGFGQEGSPVSEANYSAAYHLNDVVGYKGIILQKGNIVIRAGWNQFANGYSTVPFDEWANILFDSLGH